MKFTYTKFGTLKEVQISKPYWHIVNEEGKKVSINYHQYARTQGFLDKLNELVGYPVVYRTTRRDEARKEAGARAGVGKERMSLREAHARLVAGEQVEVAVTGLARSRAC